MQMFKLYTVVLQIFFYKNLRKSFELSKKKKLQATIHQVHHQGFALALPPHSTTISCYG